MRRIWALLMVIVLLVPPAYYFINHSTGKETLLQLNLSPVVECNGSVCVEVNPYIELTDVVFHLAGWDPGNVTPYSGMSSITSLPTGTTEQCSLPKTP